MTPCVLPECKAKLFEYLFSNPPYVLEVELVDGERCRMYNTSPTFSQERGRGRDYTNRSHFGLPLCKFFRNILAHGFGK